jgi:hypothetical protein
MKSSKDGIILSENVTYEVQKYTNDWNIFEIFNKQNLNPISKLYINVSPPCGITSKKYVKRTKSLERAYNEPNDC